MCLNPIFHPIPDVLYEVQVGGVSRGLNYRYIARKQVNLRLVRAMGGGVILLETVLTERVLAEELLY